jgi:hypothetical protein
MSWAGHISQSGSHSLHISQDVPYDIRMPELKIWNKILYRPLLYRSKYHHITFEQKLGIEANDAGIGITAFGISLSPVREFGISAISKS